MTLAQSFKLNNGLTIPAVGLGTWVRHIHSVKAKP